MTIRSHPSEATLLGYAAGTLSAGALLAVAAHLEFCKDCRKPIGTWEMAAGTTLDSLPESDLAADALARTLARTHKVETDAAPRRMSAANPTLVGVELPPAILAAGTKKKRWVAPGIWTAVIPAASRARAQTYLIGLGPGRKIPLHGHSAAEMICVLKGSFSDLSGHYESGDFVEVDETKDHQPAAGLEGECICIIAQEGPPRMRGLLGWLVQPFLG